MVGARFRALNYQTHSSGSCCGLLLGLVQQKEAHAGSRVSLGYHRHMFQMDLTTTSDSSCLLPLFADHQQLRAIRDAVLEGRFGRAWVDQAQRPAVARLDLGCYAIFGGDSTADSAQVLIESVAAPRELIYPDTAWRRRLLQAFESRLQDRPMEAFSGARLAPARLQVLAEALPAGYRCAALNADDATQLDAGLEPHGLQVYRDPEVLVRDGMAWGLFTTAAEPRLVSIASSYAMSNRSVEVAISTRPEHRGRGLAVAVAARFCLEALRRGLEPCWNAANPVSKRLARRLGFEPAGECEVLFLEGGRRRTGSAGSPAEPAA